MFYLCYLVKIFFLNWSFSLIFWFSFPPSTFWLSKRTVFFNMAWYDPFTFSLTWYALQRTIATIGEKKLNMHITLRKHSLHTQLKSNESFILNSFLLMLIYSCIWDSYLHCFAGARKKVIIYLLKNMVHDITDQRSVTFFK